MMAAPKDKAPAVATPPKFDAVRAALEVLLKRIEAELADLEGRVGAGAVLIQQVEAIVARQFTDYDWGGLQNSIKAELIALLLSGRSVVKDDDVDLA